MQPDSKKTASTAQPAQPQGGPQQPQSPQQPQGGQQSQNPPQAPPATVTQLPTAQAKKKQGRPPVNQSAFVDFMIGQRWWQNHLFNPATGWHYRQGAMGLWQCEGFDPPILVESMRHFGKERSINSAAAVKGCLYLAEHSPAFRREDAFNADNHLVGLPSGNVVNLRSGQFYQPTTELVSMKLGADPDFSNPPTQWLEFLSEVLPSQADIDYAQVLFGMCLTGYTRNQVAHFLYGTGRNGKSVFLHVLQAVAGDYHALIPAAALSPYKERHPEWIARLVGKRVATADEMHGGAWNSPAFKELSTGAKMIARRMRQDSFEFAPNASLVTGGNKLPPIKPKDADAYAMYQRIRTMHFNRTFAEADRNPNLRSQLTHPGELAKIVGWALTGGHLYLTKGLPKNTPAMAALRREWEKDAVDPHREWLKANLELWFEGKLPYDIIMAKAKEAGCPFKRTQSLTPLLRELFPIAEHKMLRVDGHAVRGVDGVRFKLPKSDIPKLMPDC